MVRLDRLITLRVVRPFCRRNRENGRILPILMYHSISESAEDSLAPYYRTTTHPAQFAAQMALLQEDGWRAVTLTEGLQAMRSPGAQVPHPKRVVLTFDDGYRNFRTAAFPVLQRHGFSATMYLPTAFIGDTTRSFQSHPCLTWAEVGELHQAGIEFGSHTVHHPKLVDMTWPAIEAEICHSKLEIEHRLGAPCTAFAYPFAFPQAHRTFAGGFTTRLRETGYESCVTTTIGCATPADDPFTLRRLPANSCDDEALLRAKLAGAYDWLAWAQSTVKLLKALCSPRSAGSVALTA
jgi:peptidoglycan/xylan/chitin deacetylase (PgdA/CDA1 family)